MNAFRQDVPHLAPTHGATLDGTNPKANAFLREVDGVPLGASSGSSSMEIDDPGNTGKSMTNQLYEDTWSLDVLLDVGAGSAHRISAETCSEFGALRVKCVSDNLGTPCGTKDVFALSSTGLDHREAVLQFATE